MSRPRYKTLKEFTDSYPRSTSVETIADQIGVSASALHSWLKGTRFPQREVALRLSREYEISLEGLLDPESAVA